MADRNRLRLKVLYAGLRRRPVASAVAVSVAASLLASCAVAPIKMSKARSKEYFAESEYGVKASPRLVAMGGEIPKGGGRYHVGEPYKVKGKVYKPRENPDYEAVGLASWYGSAFHGRKTANGEIYDTGELTAAHPTLPLPSYARVTNLKNGRSVVVRINDRGPFAKGRIIDVSATVADMLDFKRAGTAKVKVEYVGKARMDGLDRQMLVSSYEGPNDFGGETLLASTVTPVPKDNVVLAALTPRKTSRKGGVDKSMDLFGPQRLDSPEVMAPAFMPATFSNNDPLGPLILRSGFTMSYAPANAFSGAHLAAEELSERSATVEIQIGTFGERANAERIARRLEGLGRVEITDLRSPDRMLHRVGVAVTGPADDVIAAARALGASDAFIVLE